MDTAAGTPRERIEATLAHLEHVLPGQASIKDFVHHNTLHGFQHLPFPQALGAARRLTGASPWLPAADCRRLHTEGRIDDSDLDAGLDAVGGETGMRLDEVLARTPERAITCRDVLRLSLLQDLEPVPLARFRWLVAEGGALKGERELWVACLDVLELDHGFDNPEDTLEMAVRAEFEPHSPDQADLAQETAGLWRMLLEQTGRDMTCAGLLKALTGEDAPANVRAVLIRHLGAHLDLGLAPWHNPARGRGFFAAWRESTLSDLGWPLDSFPEARDIVAALPEQSLDAIEQELTRLGLPESRWAGYLERLALDLPGWSGMFLWRHNHPGYGGTGDVPVAMCDYLAVRLVLDRLVGTGITLRQWECEFSLTALGAHFQRQPAELWVRNAWAEGDLPEYLVDLVEPHISGRTEEKETWEWLAGRIRAWRDAPTVENMARHGLARSAWPLFQLARHLGLSAAELRGLGRAGAESLLVPLFLLDEDQRGYIWLLAYERHYREQILSGLSANHGRWQGHAQGPTAQLVFCMDDREEGTRRHLEEVAPDLETLGGAAHFAVFQNHYGLDDNIPTPLCPVVPEVIVPAHNVRELPRGLGLSRHRARRGLRLSWQEAINQWTRLGFLAAPLMAALAAPFALAGMAWRTLCPAGFGRSLARLGTSFDIPLPTRLDSSAPDDAGPATPAAPREGFTDAEAAERVGNYLTALGLTQDFAPLVAIVGHGGNSKNNPHLSAYDCGACAGRHSGANARLFATLANRPGVRTRLAERGIAVPEGTWFLGAEHNTTDDGVIWYDLEDLPAALRPCFDRVDDALADACRGHAKERCRRLWSAPLSLSPDAAFRHVAGRRHDWSQARPELGHATNACAFFGRRAMSRGAFFDRRAFLISYDPTQDADGRVLEKHLLINGAVGAGISLEYYFSTANNDRYGCGSKVTHNVAGYFGVMQGAASDLATGLPRQMIEVHEAMRLLVVVEQTLDVITAVYQRQPPLQELVGKRWVNLAAKDPDTGAIHLFDPAKGWLPWQGTLPVPTVTRSLDWFDGERAPLPPALLEKPLEASRP